MQFDLIYGVYQYASENLHKYSENELQELLKKAKLTDERMKMSYRLKMTDFYFGDYAYNLLKGAIDKRDMGDI